MSDATSSRSSLYPLLIAGLALFLGGWLLHVAVWKAERGRGGVGSSSSAELFEVVRDRIEEHHVMPPGPDSLHHAAIRGMIGALDDPHTTFLAPAQRQQLRDQTDGDFAGVGFQVGIRGRHPVVIAPLPDTPAEDAGLQAGDVILSVDGQSTRDWSSDRAVEAIRGPEGSDVALRLRRVRGGDTVSVTVTRQQIQVPSVQFVDVLEGAVGYLEILSFQYQTAAQVRATLDSLLAHHPDLTGLVLDLRRNPGGLLDASLGTADLFLPAGVRIAETRSRLASQDDVFRAEAEARYDSLPLAVLVGASTASGAEILAGALQDHERATLYGVRTFGKGSVQSLFPLPDGYALKLTTARWYTPRGRSLSPVRSGDTLHRGIAPDVPLADSLEEVASALFAQTSAEPLRYRDREYRLAVAYARSHPVPRTGFVVPDSLVAELMKEFEPLGSPPAGLLPSGRLWARRSLGYSIVQAEHGGRVARHWLHRHDPVLGAAVRSLLR